MLIRSQLRYQEDSDGTVWAWGQNDSAQLGDGSYKPSNNFYLVKPLDGVCDEAYPPVYHAYNGRHDFADYSADEAVYAAMIEARSVLFVLLEG